MGLPLVSLNPTAEAMLLFRSAPSVTRAGDDTFTKSVRDEGVGLPADFDPRKAKGLGMRIINSFGEQLNAKVVARARDPGMEFVPSIPLRISSEARGDRPV
jgi:two-component sensor histidine kinase